MGWTLYHDIYISTVLTAHVITHDQQVFLPAVLTAHEDPQSPWSLMPWISPTQCLRASNS